MPHERFFHPDLTQESETAVLKGQEFHHLAHVYRLRAGDELELINGQGLLAKARVERLEKEKASLTILQLAHSPHPKPELILGLALLRMNRLEWAIEKGVELGADAFYLFEADYCEKGDLSEHQIERLRNLSISALKQSGRLYLPPLLVLGSLKEALLPDTLTVFGDTDPQAPPLLSALKKGKDRVFFLSGPEKGFSKKELETLQESGALGVKLASQILRAETAPIAALSILSQWIL